AVVAGDPVVEVRDVGARERPDGPGEVERATRRDDRRGRAPPRRDAPQVPREAARPRRRDERRRDARDVVDVERTRTGDGPGRVGGTVRTRGGHAPESSRTPYPGDVNEPEVDVVVAVHTPERRVERAVLSVVLTEAPVRVTVVCHGTPLEPIAERLGVLAEDPRVRLLPFTDGVPSPAGPFNAGLDAATAPWVSVLGSDDVLEVGAIDSWLALAGRTG